MVMVIVSQQEDEITKPLLKHIYSYMQVQTNTFINPAWFLERIFQPVSNKFCLVMFTFELKAKKEEMPQTKTWL